MVTARYCFIVHITYITAPYMIIHTTNGWDKQKCSGWIVWNLPSCFVFKCPLSRAGECELCGGDTLHWNCFNQQTFEENINSSRNCYKPDVSEVYYTTLCRYIAHLPFSPSLEWDGYELITLASEWFWSGVGDCELTAECGSQHQKTDRFIPAWPERLPTYNPRVPTLHVYKHLAFLL